MLKVVSNLQMRTMDSRAINEYGIPGIVLMENAGRNSAEIIIDKCIELNIYNVLIFAGKGNNGGDGFVIARYLEKSGLDVIVYLAADINSIKGDAKVNLDICLKSGINIQECDSVEHLLHPGQEFLIVDALLGTGVKGKTDGFYAAIIDWINKNGSFTCAIDIPSGISSDSCDVVGAVVEADMTITMGLPKLSQFFYPARTMTGDLEVVDIGFPEHIENNGDIFFNAVFEEDIILDPPVPVLNKHSAGRVFILGGSPGMTGALVLAAKGASLAGAGLVVAGVAKTLNPILETKLTEQMSLPLADDGKGFLSVSALPGIKEKIDWCDVLLIGPGAGREKETLSLLEDTVLFAIQQNKKIIIDADALYLLSLKEDLLKMLNENCILTPHHGEFLRIFPAEKNRIVTQPWQSLKNALEKLPCVINLKGGPSLCGQKDKGIFINTTGNPGLAKGGSGDLLGGLIAGFSASGLDLLTASYYANFIHGKAADEAAEKWGVRAFSMENLISRTKKVYRELCL